MPKKEKRAKGIRRWVLAESQRRSQGIIALKFTKLIPASKQRCAITRPRFLHAATPLGLYKCLFMAHSRVEADTTTSPLERSTKAST